MKREEILHDLYKYQRQIVPMANDPDRKLYINLLNAITQEILILQDKNFDQSKIKESQNIKDIIAEKIEVIKELSTIQAALGGLNRKCNFHYPPNPENIELLNTVNSILFAFENREHFGELSPDDLIKEIKGANKALNQLMELHNFDDLPRRDVNQLKDVLEKSYLSLALRENELTSSQMNPSSNQASTAAHMNPNSNQASTAARMNPNSNQASTAARMNPSSNQASTAAHMNPNSNQASTAAHMNPNSNQASTAAHMNPNSNQASTAAHMNPNSNQASTAARELKTIKKFLGLIKLFKDNKTNNTRKEKPQKNSTDSNQQTKPKT